MKRYILTGAPGCGKTAIIRELAMQGASVVAEAATDVIAAQQAQGQATPWVSTAFIDDICNLQKQRQIAMSHDNADLQFYDRSPICTYALALYLGFKPSDNLLAEIDRIQKNNIYEQQVFFIANLGFITPTAARKISFEESLRFEQIHLDVYQQFDYECVMVPVGEVMERVGMVLGWL